MNILIVLVICSQIDTIIIKEQDKAPLYYRDPVIVEQKLIDILKEDTTIITYNEERGICV